MAYETEANASTPALIIYLLDVSGSMSSPMSNGKRRIDVVMEAFDSALQEMIARSTRGQTIRPRYRVAMLAYSEHVYDLLGGIRTIDYVASLGVPALSTMTSTQTSRAFEQARALLAAEIPSMGACPAPLICHMTDGEYNGGDPEPIVREIMSMAVPDGHVLVENIFISDTVLLEPVRDARLWPGILPTTPLIGEYSQKLRAMSSTLPPSYRALLSEIGYSLGDGVSMLVPGMNPDLVGLGFQMSGATPTGAVAWGH